MARVMRSGPFMHTPQFRSPDGVRGEPCPGLNPGYRDNRTVRRMGRTAQVERSDTHRPRLDGYRAKRLNPSYWLSIKLPVPWPVCRAARQSHHYS